ncbi:hypothetical protein C8P68_102114 [Mucilaginibacter yixingensis]|uniref:TraB family protein n=1 Tax=Mucilaginibacter yixingensis TaxID=1295612 RepID=A0A2T5JC17_9SPHI|nr:TraB/GumN family protein [Mucilaginibacter yixingensis]PTQ99298.1 hypothetical protein C8P68_102114 [Mucilaginibacter yixingensis]
MKKILSLACVVLLLCTACHAQSKPTQYTNSGLLWEISGNGLKSPSYLFGTYHLAGKSFADSLSTIKEKFNTCTAVVGEILISKTDMYKMMPAMMLRGTTLDKLFTPQEYQQITEATKQITGSDMLRFNGLKPSALTVVYMTTVAPRTISSANPALDEYFQTEGKSRKDTIIGLESLQEQIDLLLNGSMESQKKHLLKFVQKHDLYKMQMQKMYRLYEQQDIDGLSKMFYSDDDYDQDEMDALLKKRNLKWMQELPGIMSAQSTFIAVGAGHLVGEYGLVNQLKMKGYTVRAVKL